MKTNRRAGTEAGPTRSEPQAQTIGERVNMLNPNRAAEAVSPAFLELEEAVLAAGALALLQARLLATFVSDEQPGSEAFAAPGFCEGVVRLAQQAGADSRTALEEYQRHILALMKVPGFDCDSIEPALNARWNLEDEAVDGFAYRFDSACTALGSLVRTLSCHLTNLEEEGSFEHGLATRERLLSRWKAAGRVALEVRDAALALQAANQLQEAAQ